MSAESPIPPLDPAPPPAAASASGRALRIALFASIALNLLIVGAIGGAVLGERRDRGDDHRVDERALTPLGLGLYARALDPADRAALLDDARARRDELGAARRALGRDMAALARAVRAEPFDAERARAVLGRQGRTVMQQLEIGRDLLVTRLAAMSPEARAAFADHLESAVRRAPRPPAP